MKARKKWKFWSFGKVSTKFIFITFIALTVYVFVILVSSTSMLSVKVDMFIKMHGIAMNIRTGLGNRTFDNETDTRENEQQLVNRSFNLFVSDGSKQKVDNVDTNRQSIEIHSDNKEDVLLTFLGSDGKRKYATMENFSDSKKPQGQNTEMSVSGTNQTSKGFYLYSEENEENKTKNRIDIFGNLAHGTDKKRKLECDRCFQHNFNYVIENDICKVYNSEEIIDLLILITTSHKNTRARTALRATWLSFTRGNTANIRYAFLLGEHKGSMYRDDIKRENDAFHDIIKEDFVDSYMNLTYKTIMGFKWAATKCAHAQFVMKTDDDMFVNIPNVLKIISGPLSDTLQTAIAGSCSQKAKPIRNRKSKWYASVDSYPQQMYPGFCSGTGYVTSMNVATKIYQISPNIPFFHLEDVYVALCLRKLRFKLQRVPGFNTGRRKLDPCLYKGRLLITAHQMTPGMLQLIWKKHCVPLHF